MAIKFWFSKPIIKPETLLNNQIILTLFYIFFSKGFQHIKKEFYIDKYEI